MVLEQFVTSFVLGIFATGAPCILPLYPGFLAYLSGGSKGFQKNVKTHYLGFFVFLGVLTTMILLGLIIASLSVAVGQVVSIVTPLVDVIIVALGILLLMNKNIFANIPKIKIPLMRNPYANSYAYGLLYGPVALPCTGPFLVSIFALSVSAGSFLNSLLLFFIFGLGFGIPLFLLSLLARAKSQWLINKFVQNQKIINRIAGIILIAVGLYDFFINYEFIMLYLFG